MNLYVDDLRICPENFEIARTYEDAIKKIRENNINILSLDHDLGLKNGVEKTGLDIVKYICENNIFINSIYIHSDNVVGRENMYQTLLGAQRRGFINSNIKIHNYNYCKNKYI